MNPVYKTQAEYWEAYDEFRLLYPAQALGHLRSKTESETVEQQSEPSKDLTSITEWPDDAVSVKTLGKGPVGASKETPVSPKSQERRNTQRRSLSATTTAGASRQPAKRDQATAPLQFIHYEQAEDNRTMLAATSTAASLGAPPANKRKSTPAAPAPEESGIGKIGAQSSRMSIHALLE